MTTTNVTETEAHDGLVAIGSPKWVGDFTYSVPGAGAVWAGGYGKGEPTDPQYGTLDTTQADNFRAAIEMWDALIAPAATEVPDSAPGQIRIAFTDVTAREGPNVSAYAYSPSIGGESPVAGDVWLDETLKSSSLAARTSHFQLLLHEIGHSLGLKHPFASPTLPAGYDSTTYTVMSYTGEDNFYSWSGGGGSISYSVSRTVSFTPMVLDILAIQSHYGADTSTATGDTVYSFTDTGLNGRQAIHDAGGKDTLDLSALSRGSNVDLRPGAYSDIAYYNVEDQIDDLVAQYGSGFEPFIRNTLTGSNPPAYEWEKNVGIAFSTTIENVIGSGQADSIIGNDVANMLDGRAGIDRLEGLKGNDTYIVDNAADVIVEIAGGGTADWVKASLTFDLLAGVHVEKLSTTNDKGTAKINLYGNEIAQTITGNAAANILSDGGKGGSDTLIGLGGNDTYRVYNSGTKIVEAAAAGSDTVEAAVNYTVGAGVYIQVLETTNAAGKAAISLYSNEFGQTVNGNAGANVLRGYGGNDTINGAAGDDRISGGLGNDTLAGNAGADTYYFSYALNASTNVDTIKGFSSIDLISLSSAIFTKAGPAGALAASAFWASTTGLAHDSTDRIMWETDTGILRYDPDGTGAAAPTAFAVVTGNTGAINAGDFVIA